VKNPPIAPRNLKNFGFAEWFRPGEYRRVEQALDGMRRAGVRYIRTHLSWAEYHSSGGQEWYDWLIPFIGRDFDLLPCIHYTPPSLSRTGTSAGPPHRILDYADFIDHVLGRYGSHLDAVELWNEPNNLLDWDWRLDTDWQLFCEMIGAAGYWAQERGFRTVLGGPCPFDAHWLRLLGERGVLGVMSAVGLHGFPGTWDSEASTWDGWERQVSAMRSILDAYNPQAEIWITEAGYSTWRKDEAVQARSFLEALEAPADRLYWYGWQDIAGDVAVQEGLRFDDRHYHMGVVDVHGTPKLLGRLLMEGGIAGVARTLSLSAPNVAKPVEPIVVTGGAGFIGSHLAESLLADGREVVVFDNLSRPGVEGNLQWLKDRHGDRLHPIIGDVRDEATLSSIVRDAEAVFHLAGQGSAVGYRHPVNDFEVNVRGTLNVLEAIRRANRRIPAVFASSSKVYGSLASIPVREGRDRYSPVDQAVARWGICEEQCLDFQAPLDCSSGAADQYVLSYARTYDLPALVMRMSCIYGPRQIGAEEQGWLARFLIQALNGQSVTISGDGKQVRDLLHVSDASSAFRAALDGVERVKGQAFNLGGGPRNAVSIRIALDEIEALLGRGIDIRFSEPRQDDRAYFVSDTRKLEQSLGWEPKTGWQEGIAELHDWFRSLPSRADKASREAVFPHPPPQAAARAEPA
jgi:CDP-paratose 2-epimerase